MPSGGETERDPSGWTTDTLRALMDQRFSDLLLSLNERDLRYEQRFSAQQQALAEKKETTDARLDLLNESRQTIDDLVSRTMPRAETDSRMEQLESRISENALRSSEAIAQINRRLDLAAGRGAGLEKGWAILAGAIAIAATVIAIVLALSP